MSETLPVGYLPMRGKQEPDQFRWAVHDGHEGLGPRVYVFLPCTRHGITAVTEVAGRGLLIYVRVADDPTWYAVLPTQFAYQDWRAQT